MRLLIFHGYLLRGTGSNVYNAELAEALARLGHEVHLLCQDRDIRNFRFNQDYRIDLILWREIIGGITDALYLKPGVSYAFNDNFSLFGNFIYSKALKPTSTPSGTSTQLGLEIDAGVRFQTDDGFYAQLAYGILFPFDGLQYNYPSIYIGAPISPSVAQAIRAQLGIRF